MKKILLIYQGNFLPSLYGANTRVLELVRIFNEVGFSVDQFSFENFSPNDTFVNFEKQNTEKLINKLYTYDFAKVASKGARGLGKRVLWWLGRKKAVTYLHDWTNDEMRAQVKKITNENNYDVIIVLYAYLANLLKGYTGSARKVYFMEDSVFLQQYFWDSNKPEITLGKLLDEEIERLKLFNDIFCISYDEKIMHEKLTGKVAHFLPHMNTGEVRRITFPLEKKKWDIMFVGFNNPFNVDGLNWFVKDVYPLLNKGLRLVFVGSVTEKLEVTHSNIDIISYAPDLDEIYNNVKLTICPMFRGTGMKIKVVESMARGIPIVCNARGVDGFPDKTMCGCLVTEDAKEFADYINRLLTDTEFYREVSETLIRYYNLTFNRDRYKELLKKVL